MRECANVAVDTADVLRRTSLVAANAHTRISSFDVEQLYPSLSQAFLQESIRKALTHYFQRMEFSQWGFRVEFAMALLDIVLESQIVTYRFSDPAVAQPTDVSQFFLQMVGDQPYEVTNI